MRQPPFSTEIPIVMLTAMSSDVQRAQALEAGTNDIWSKPFDMEIFCQRIGELLSKDKRSFCERVCFYQGVSTLTKPWDRMPVVRSAGAHPRGSPARSRPV